MKLFFIFRVKNIALILAGGAGKRICLKDRPKQFLELHDKPLIIYTLEHFEHHPKIDGIVIPCIETWIPYLQELLQRYNIHKVATIVPGGVSCQDSIYNGLTAILQTYGRDCNVLIHDAVRPLINEQTITDCIRITQEKGNCITCSPATETVMILQPNSSHIVPDRQTVLLARAPQCFRLTDILHAHQRAQAIGRHDFVDSSSLMTHFGHKLHTIIGPDQNIKVTTLTDYNLLLLGHNSINK